MIQNQDILPSKDQRLAHEHCFDNLPYSMIVFYRLNQNKHAVYYVAGVMDGPYSGENALKKAFEKHGGKCHYCEKSVTPNEFSIDHVEPKTLGGKNNLNNLVISCKSCNIKKQHQLIEVFSPNAGKKWLLAMQKRIEQRLKQL